MFNFIEIISKYFQAKKAYNEVMDLHAKTDHELKDFGIHRSSIQFLALEAADKVWNKSNADIRFENRV
jgi:uncharacterized protein YjiS (DUF1127 family)